MLPPKRSQLGPLGAWTLQDCTLATEAECARSRSLRDQHDDIKCVVVKVV
jgi:hypothetical protein